MILKMLKQILIMSKYAFYGVLVQCVVITMLIAEGSSAQYKSVDNIYVTVSWGSIELVTALKELEEKSNLHFSYEDNIPLYAQVSIKEKNASLRTILENLAQSQHLNFKRINGNIHVARRSFFGTSIEEEIWIVDKEISGKITGEDSEVLPGVSVVVKGTSLGTISDSEGIYRLDVPDDAQVLVFSYIGYETQEAIIGQKSVIDVTLELDITQLSEIVVLGYGSQEKQDVTGAVSVIKGKTLVKAPTVNLAAGLAGKITGVQTIQQSGQPGFDDVTLRIRGISSFRGGQQPLVIVDGIERPLSRINPNNIASISILKDASATAVYGRKGANGVVLVTTKRGASGKPSFTYDVRFGRQKQTREVEVMNAAEYSRLLNQAKENVGEPLPFTDQEIASYENDTLPSFDWTDALYKNSAFQQQHNFSVSGGTDLTKYFVSYGHLEQEGILESSHFKQNSLRSNIDLQLTERLSLGVDLLGRIENRDASPFTDGGENSVYSATVFANPTLNPFPDVPGVPDAIAFNGFSGTPVGAANRSGFSERDRNVLQSTIQFQYDIPGVEGLNARGLYAYDYTATRNTAFQIPYDFYSFNDAAGEFERLSSGDPSQIISSENRNGFNRRTLQLSLSYEKSFNDHDLSALLLFEQITSDFDRLSASRTGFLSDAISQLNAGSFDDVQNSSAFSEQASRGWVGRLSYSYKNRYLLQLNGRLDKSFAFAEEFRTGFFPSFSIGWRVSDEPFLAGSTLFNNLKIRGSWGQVGNDNVPQFQYLSTFGISGGVVRGGGNFLNGINSSGIANPSITWETTTTTNLGLDAGILDGKIELELDYFFRKTEDILDTPDGVVPASFGASILDRPIGEMESRGLEALLRHSNNIGGLAFTVEGNLTWSNNEVTKFSEPEDILPAIAQVGRPWQERIGYVAEGLFQSQEDIDGHATQELFGQVVPGDIKYSDVNGDGEITPDDRTVIGDSNIPNLTFGFNLNVQYKGFDLQANLQGAGQYSLYLPLIPFQLDGNSLRELTDSWSPENPDARYPRLTAGSLLSNNGQTTTTWIREVNYFRLRNLEVGYNFTGLKDQLNAIGISNLRMFLAANNLFTLSNLDWRDPEGGGESTGNAYPFYPQLRTVSLGLNVGF